MDIKRNITEFITALDSDSITLIAVSKTRPAGDILAAYETGHRDFGENRVQELVAKFEELPKDIRWHMIGHLQRNKVKYIAPFVYLIHGVDSLRLLETINREGEKNNRIIPCLLQVHIARESTKFGMSEAEVYDAISKTDALPFVNIRGLMGMATLTRDEIRIQQEFEGLRRLFDQINADKLITPPLDILSMGMSGDYQLAIQSGSTMVRVGSAIFGSRNQ